MPMRTPAFYDIIVSEDGMIHPALQLTITPCRNAQTGAAAPIAMV